MNPMNPMNPKSRYDFLIEKGLQLLRVILEIYENLPPLTFSHAGWRLVRVNLITRAESNTILGCPIVFGHHKLSDSSDPGRIRTQPSQNQSGSDRASEPHDEIG